MNEGDRLDVIGTEDIVELSGNGNTVSVIIPGTKDRVELEYPDDVSELTGDTKLEVEEVTVVREEGAESVELPNEDGTGGP